MKHTPDPGNFDELKDYVLSLFPPQLDSLAVSPASQQEELRSLARTIGSQRFFFVVDMLSFEITHIEGLQRWMGYNEKEFRLKKYWGLVHPGIQKLAHTVFMQMAEILCKGNFKLEFMVQRYSSLVALKHYNGHYLLLKRTASVFQYDTANRLTEYLNEFTIIGNYEGQPLTPTFFTDKGEAEQQRGELLMKKVLDDFLRLKVFSVNEMHVARILAYQPALSKKEIAAILNQSPHTIDTYLKRFLKKAREYYHYDFETSLEAAIYLQKNGLL